MIDAKAPLDAYLAALEAQDDASRRQHLQRHAQQVAARVRELAAKSYWLQFPRAPEFVILFIPGDQFLSAALAVQPQLIEEALAASVVLATPSTLMAVLKCVAYCWRQNHVTQNARQIQELAGELHGRLTTLPRTSCEGGAAIVRRRRSIQLGGRLPAASGRSTGTPIARFGGDRRCPA